MSPSRHPIAVASAIALLVALAGCSVHADTAGGSNASSGSGTSAAAAAGDASTPPAKSGGSTSAFCTDATGDLGLSGDQSSPTAEALAAWDKMAADAPAKLHDDVATVDAALHKASKGDGSAAEGSAFSNSIAAVATWIAENCDLSAG